MNKSNVVTFGIVVWLLAILASACSGQATPLVITPSKTPTLIPTSTSTNTPAPTPSPTPSPTPTPIFVVRANSEVHSNNPNTFTYVGIQFDTFDPVTSYRQIIQNVYEPLIFYDGEKTDVFVPFLADSWEISPDGKTYTFHIREGVNFHNGDKLTPSDVAYSFYRVILHGGYGQWLLTEPFFGTGILDVTHLVDSSGDLVGKTENLKRSDPEALKAACEKVKSAIVADDTAGTVTMNLTQAWNAFLPSLATYSVSVMDAKWVAENNGWDGSCETWQKYYDPKFLESPFDKIANGTGPFKLIQWSRWGVITLERNDDYWRDPAKLEKVSIKYEWNGNTALSMIKSGLADAGWVQDDYQSQINDMVGERCEYDLDSNIYSPCELIDEAKPLVVFSGRPVNFQYVLLFNYDIKGSYGNRYIDSAKLDGNGIPSDFFSDVHVRKAFAYCFDWDTFITEVYEGNAVQSTQLLLPGVIGFDSELPHYKFDLASCKKEFMLADVDKDGIPAEEDPDDIWEKGFQFSAIYTSGDFSQTVSEILADNVNSINPKFKVRPLFLPIEEYYAAQTDGLFPMTISGWREDIHDPYNWFQPYTKGEYGKSQSLPDDLTADFQEIFNRGLVEKDLSKRAEIYQEANMLYFNEAIGIPFAITTIDYYWQRWVEGITLNPYFPQTYFYPISKK